MLTEGKDSVQYLLILMERFKKFLLVQSCSVEHVDARRSTAPSLPLQFVFPGLAVKIGAHTHGLNDYQDNDIYHNTTRQNYAA